MINAILASIVLIGSLELDASIVRAPSTYITRAEASMLLISSAHIPLAGSTQPLLYPDTIPGEWYVPYIRTAVNMGMLDADAHYGLIHPHGSVTRSEFLKMLSIAFKLSTNIPYQYTDTAPDAWYKPYLGIAYREGLFRDANNPLLLHPDVRVSQDEAVYVIQQITRSLQKSQEVSATSIRKQLETAENGSYFPAAPEEGASSSVSIRLPTFATSPLVVKAAMLKIFAAKSNSLDDTRLAILQRVNDERKKAGMHILRHNAILAKAAQAHAKDMTQRGYFSHFTPEGKSYVDRVRDAGYLDSEAFACPCAPSINTQDLLQNRRDIGPDYILMKSGDSCECKARFALGENIAKGQLTPEQVMSDWMQSENHRKNILSGAFDEIGIGIFNDAWVQDFGKLEMP